MAENNTNQSVNFFKTTKIQFSKTSKQKVIHPTIQFMFEH